jgi:hypothetical protein
MTTSIQIAAEFSRPFQSEPDHQVRVAQVHGSEAGLSYIVLYVVTPFKKP